MKRCDGEKSAPLYENKKNWQVHHKVISRILSHSNGKRLRIVCVCLCVTHIQREMGDVLNGRSPRDTQTYESHTLLFFALFHTHIASLHDEESNEKKMQTNFFI